MPALIAMGQPTGIMAFQVCTGLFPAASFRGFVLPNHSSIFMANNLIMNRKKAIRNIILLGGGTAALLAGWKGYNILKKPSFSKLDEHQLLIDELAELIIPETDTPGAGKAGVGRFISIMVRDCTSRQAQNKFIDGVEDLAAYAKSRYDKTFLQCSPADKISILQHFEEKGRGYKGMLGKAETKFLGDSFFTTLKKYTVMGYCTSKQGATSALRYDYIPGSYQGNVPLTPGQTAWATK